MLKALPVTYHALPAWSDDPANAVELMALGTPIPTLERDATRHRELIRDANDDLPSRPGVLSLVVFDTTRGETVYLPEVKEGSEPGQYTA